jgi:DNA-binding CsgD family transcriptional regulator
MRRARDQPVLAPPPGLRVVRFRLGPDEYVALSYPAPGLEAAAALLTVAERDVVAAVLSGSSNREIARARGRSPRTVANQVAAAFRKLGVGSRVELAAVLRGPMTGAARRQDR